MREPYPPHKRRGRLLRSGAGLVVLLAVAGYLALQYVTHGPSGPGCRVVSDQHNGRSYEFTPEQAVNAATITAVGTSRGLPERAVTIALATAIQESSLRNIRYGDRDSLGLFQQRPSQGWGTAEQIMDPAYAAGQFYAHLVKVHGYLRLPLTQAAQRVQHSGFPDAYAPHEADAELLAAALTGHAAATLTCQGRPAPTSAGGPDAVRAALARDFGRDVLQQTGAAVTPRQAGTNGTRSGGTTSSPASTASTASTTSTTSAERADDPGLLSASARNTPGGEGSSSSAPAARPASLISVSTSLDDSGDKGRTVTVPLPPATDRRAGSPAVDSNERGWQLAHWAVANASELHIERVSFAGREWRAGPGATNDGWLRTTGTDDKDTQGDQGDQGADGSQGTHDAGHARTAADTADAGNGGDADNTVRIVTAPN